VKEKPRKINSEIHSLKIHRKIHSEIHGESFHVCNLVVGHLRVDKRNAARPPPSLKLYFRIPSRDQLFCGRCLNLGALQLALQARGWANSLQNLR
jgi:hypothetical protein